jgi:hypothetical protein
LEPFPDATAALVDGGRWASAALQGHGLLALSPPFDRCAVWAQT